MTIRDQTRGRPRPKDSTAPPTKQVNGATHESGSPATTNREKPTSQGAPHLRLVRRPDDELPALPADTLDEIGQQLIGLGNTVRSAARFSQTLDAPTRQHLLDFTAKLRQRLAQAVA
jgi:hypothetical protein